MAVWFVLFTGCGDEAPPPVKTESAVSSPPAVSAQEAGRVEAVVLGTGAATGDYYRIGDAIAGMLNMRQSTYRLQCAVEATGGSLVNVHAVLSGDLQFGLTRARWNYEAAKGLGIWQARGAQKELRSVFSLPFAPAPSSDIPEARDPVGNPSETPPPGDPAMAALVGTTTLVTSAKVPERIVYNFTRAVFENLSKLQALHPAFAGATPQRMLQGLSAPIHPGALRYYKEAGWM